MATVPDIAGETVNYWRGAVSVALTATMGTTQFQTVDSEGMTIGFCSTDWIFQASDLVIAGQATVPRRGDRLTRTVAGRTFTYEVLPDSEQVFRYCDRDRTFIRVHTKERAA